MSKDNNLHDFLQDVADAIREKKGSTDKINAQSFAEEIRSIESGGGEVQNTMGFTAEVYDATKISTDNFKTIRVNDGVTSLGTSVFSAYKYIEELYLPKSVQTLSTGFIAVARLKKIQVEDGNNTYDSRENCNAIIKKESLYNRTTTLVLGGNLTIIPEDVEALSYACMQGALLIESIDVPHKITSIPSYAIAECTALKRVLLKGAITNIASYAFYNNTAMEVYDFTRCTSIPTLAGTSAFSKIPTTCKIVVPDALYDDWIVATNWSSLADYIVKSSEYTE
jgi:hypothetical protein